MENNLKQDNNKPIPENFCAICLEKDISSNLIVFSCKHFFCIKCSPCLLLSCLRSPKQILEDFFLKVENNCSCPICSTGTALIPSEKFLQCLDEPGKIICEGCEKEPVNFCVDCNKIFCNKCMEEVHLPKKYQNHRLSNIHDLVQKPQYQCVCPGKHYLSHICLSCKTSICPFCLKVEHEKHDVLPLMGLSKYYQEELQAKLIFLSKTCINLLNSASSARQRFNQLVDDIVSELLDLKKSNEKKFSLTEKASASQNELAQTILTIVNKELTQKDLHPNKQFHISRALNDLKFPRDQEQNNNEEKNIKELLKIKEMVLNMKQTPEADLNNFKSNPIELFQDPKNEFILEEKTFSGNCSCSFIMNGQSYISWAGYSNDKDMNSFINIYNFSQMKREKSIPNDGDEIVLNFLSVFPKNKNTGYKGNKLLYSGDRKGIVRIYEISSKQTSIFKLKSKLQTNAGEIFSIMIFFDKFMELGVHNEKLKMEEYLCFCYIMITTSDKSILLYKNTRNYSKENNWILFRQTDNPVNASCYSMEYFYDEGIHKTRFFFGFTGNYIGSYDIKSNSWGKTELSTKRIVTSIISIFKPGKSHINEWFLVYTQANSNSVIVGNTSKGKIDRKVCLENVNDIYDCCLWNDSSSETKGNEAEICYLIVSCYGWPPSIVILDFYTLNVLFLKKMDPYPVNSIKVLRKIGEKNSEGLICFLGHSEKSKIVFYENMKD